MGGVNQERSLAHMAQSHDLPPSPAPLAVAKPPEAADAPGRAISAFSNVTSFETAQRMAKSLAMSTLVPKEYQGNIPNVLIAMELASRIGASVFMVMQSLDVIHGRPAWRAQFLIATVNSSGRFTPIRFQFSGKVGTDEWGCRAVATDRKTGEECTGSLITLRLAKEEGWYSKSGSKWKTMPEQMLMYRAGAFWTRVYAPEIGLGMMTAEEIIDTTGVDTTELPAALSPGSSRALEAELLGAASDPVAVAAAAQPYDPATGEVLGDKEAEKPEATPTAEAQQQPAAAESKTAAKAEKPAKPQRQPGEEG